MATITKRGDTYRITVSCGYDLNGKQIRRTMTWTPEPGMTRRQTRSNTSRSDPHCPGPGSAQGNLSCSMEVPPK